MMSLIGWGLLGLCPANERWRYFVTTSLIGWVPALAQPCYTVFLYNFDGLCIGIWFISRALLVFGVNLSCDNDILLISEMKRSPRQWLKYHWMCLKPQNALSLLDNMSASLIYFVDWDWSDMITFAVEKEWVSQLDHDTDLEILLNSRSVWWSVVILIISQLHELTHLHVINTMSYSSLLQLVVISLYNNSFIQC